MQGVTKKENLGSSHEAALAVTNIKPDFRWVQGRSSWSSQFSRQQRTASPAACKSPNGCDAEDGLSCGVGGKALNKAQMAFKIMAIWANHNQLSPLSVEMLCVKTLAHIEREHRHPGKVATKAILGLRIIRLWAHNKDVKPAEVSHVCHSVLEFLKKGSKGRDRRRRKNR